jgi:hypothetical protein
MAMDTKASVSIDVPQKPEWSSGTIGFLIIVAKALFRIADPNRGHKRA